jgi:hypothetical protein
VTRDVRSSTGEQIHERGASARGMTLDEMFADQDTLTFEERRAELVAIIRSAADFAGADYGLRSIFEQMCATEDEKEFEKAFKSFVTSMSESTAQFLQNT